MNDTAGDLEFCEQQTAAKPRQPEGINISSQKTAV